jgi:ADP-ribose pyrophosphatase YjhB (NUDIX family)
VVTYPLCPCAIVMHRDVQSGLWLSISRIENPDDCGFIGGKLEGGETPEQGARREFKEETMGGLVVGNLILVYVDAVPSGRQCFAFAALEVTLPDRLPTTREGSVQWRPEHCLTAPSSTYASYNEEALTAFKRIIPC